MWPGGGQSAKRREELARLDALGASLGLQVVETDVAMEPQRRRTRLAWLAGLVAMSLLLGLAYVKLTAAPLPRGIPRSEAYAVEAEPVQAPVTASGGPTATGSSGTRLVPQPVAPPGQRGYSLLEEGPEPTAFDPCRPVNFVVSEQVSLPGGYDLVHDALTMTQPVSGLSLVLEGRTDEVAAGDRPAMDVARYGDRWAPVLVTFTSPQFVPRLDGRTVGLGRGVVTRDGPRGTIVSGVIQIDAPGLQELLSRSNGRMRATAVIAHEVGHVLGLGHTDDRSQLMAAEEVDQVGWGDGDRRGFAALAARPCG